jgi:SET domain-containing protein
MTRTSDLSLVRDQLRRNPALVIRRSSIHRWGVFASGYIYQYDLLEESPYFEVPNEQAEAAPECDRYTYWLSDESMLIGMGYAGLYNHSPNANAAYEIDYVNNLIRHYAIRNISPGEELTLNYGEDNVSRFNLT